MKTQKLIKNILQEIGNFALQNQTNERRLIKIRKLKHVRWNVQCTCMKRRKFYGINNDRKVLVFYLKKMSFFNII